jgi:ER lumen protein retaining receptor
VRLCSHGFFCRSSQSRHTVWISGTVQTVFYCDFFYYYIKSWRNNEKLKLPA